MKSIYKINGLKITHRDAEDLLKAFRLYNLDAVISKGETITINDLKELLIINDLRKATRETATDIEQVKTVLFHELLEQEIKYAKSLLELTHTTERACWKNNDEKQYWYHRGRHIMLLRLIDVLKNLNENYK